MIIFQRFLAILLWIPMFYFLDKGVNSSVIVYVNDNNVSFIVTVLLDLLVLQIFLYGNKMLIKTFDFSDKVNE